jgi:hypothetical protein
MEDISSFLGPSPAPEVKRALPLIAKLEQKDLRALLPKALQYLKGEDLKDSDIAALQVKDQGNRKLPLAYSLSRLGIFIFVILIFVLYL